MFSKFCETEYFILKLLTEMLQPYRKYSNANVYLDFTEIQKHQKVKSQQQAKKEKGDPLIFFRSSLQ